MHPGEGEVRGGVRLRGVLGHRARAQGVPQRALPRAEDHRRPHEHPGRSVEHLEAGVGVALGDRVVAGVVRHRVGGLVHVPHPGTAVVDRRGRHVHQQADPCLARRGGDGGGALDADLLLGGAVGAHRVHRGHQGGRPLHQSGGLGRVGELPDDLGDPVECGRGAAAAYDGADRDPALREGGAHVRPHEAVGPGHHDGLVDALLSHVPHRARARLPVGPLPRVRT